MRRNRSSQETRQPKVCTVKPGLAEPQSLVGYALPGAYDLLTCISRVYALSGNWTLEAYLTTRSRPKMRVGARTNGEPNHTAAARNRMMGCPTLARWACTGTESPYYSASCCNGSRQSRGVSENRHGYKAIAISANAPLFGRKGDSDDTPPSAERRIASAICSNR